MRSEHTSGTVALLCTLLLLGGSAPELLTLTEYQPQPENPLTVIHPVTTPDGDQQDLTSAFTIRGADVTLDVFFSGNQNYNANAWTILRGLGVNLIRCLPGNAGDVANFNIDDDASWAENLEAFLATADSYGMKVMFYEMGSKYGPELLLGIVPYGYTGAVSIPTAQAMIDKLAGDNSLSHDFVTDSRVFAWSSSNEQDLTDASALAWNLAVCDYIRGKGGKALIAAPTLSGMADIDDAVTAGAALNGHVDYLEFHNYGEYEYYTYFNRNTQSYGGWSTLYDYMIDSYANMTASPFFDADHVFHGEFGCWLGVGSNEGLVNVNFTDQDRINLYTDVLHAAEDAGIKNICFHVCFSQVGEAPNYGVIKDPVSGTGYWSSGLADVIVVAYDAYFNVNASASTGGSIAPSGAISVRCDGSQAFTATTTAGYFFNYFSLDGAVYSSSSPLTYSGVIAGETHNLTAVFIQYTPTNPQVYYVEAYAGVGGSVSPSGQTVVEYPAGHIDLTATASYAYTFTRWKLNGVNYSTSAAITYSAGTPPNVYVFTAEFTADPAPTPTYTITASAGDNGSITNDGENVVDVGTAYTSLATADVDFIFSHWTRDAALYSTANPIFISLSQGEEATLAAVFIADTESPPDPVEPEPTPEPAPPTPSTRFNLLVGNMERQTPDGSIWDKHVWVSGLWDKCVFYRTVERQQEKAPVISFSSVIANLEKRL